MTLLELAEYKYRAKETALIQKYGEEKYRNEIIPMACNDFNAYLKYFNEGRVINVQSDIHRKNYQRFY